MPHALRVERSQLKVGRVHRRFGTPNRYRQALTAARGEFSTVVLGHTAQSVGGVDARL